MSDHNKPEVSFAEACDLMVKYLNKSPSIQLRHACGIPATVVSGLQAEPEEPPPVETRESVFA